MLPDTNCSAPEVHLLGEIVIAFGNLEMSLEVSIWQLLNFEAGSEQFMMAQALTAGMPFAGKVHAFGSMFRQRKMDQAETELIEVINGLFAAEAERNQLFHSAWSYSDVFDGDLMRTKASVRAGRGGTLKRSFHRMTAERIEETLNRIQGAGGALAWFTIKYIQGAPESEK